MQNPNGIFCPKCRGPGNSSRSAAAAWPQPCLYLFMKINFKHWALAIAMVAGPLAAQDHEQDYSKNKTYQQGMRDGKADHARNKDHSKKRHYKKDEDNKAYEAGYQKSRN